MGVFCTDRLTGEVLGVSRRLWHLTGQVLLALDSPHLEAYRPDGYVPSRVAHAWADRVFRDLGELTVIARPLPGRDELRPVAVLRRAAAAGAVPGSRARTDRPAPAWGPGAGGALGPASSPYALPAAWQRAGEQLSIYDLPAAPALLRVAQFCAASTGHTTTTLRPPAPGSAVSPVAARVLQARSGLYATAR